MAENKKKTLPSPSSLSARERILRTAQQLFYQNGIRATGIDSVIADASVTKVTLYRHFPSKEDLIEAFLEQRHHIWIAWFKGAIEEARDKQTAAARQRKPLDPVLSAAEKLFAATTFRGCAFANTVAELGTSVPSILGIAARHKADVCAVIMTLLPPHKKAHDLAWAATLALDGAIVNAQTGDQAAATSLDGLKTLLDALARQ